MRFCVIVVQVPHSLTQLSFSVFLKQLLRSEHQITITCKGRFKSSIFREWGHILEWFFLRWLLITLAWRARLLFVRMLRACSTSTWLTAPFPQAMQGSIRAIQRTVFAGFCTEWAPKLKFCVQFKIELHENATDGEKKCADIMQW